MRSRLALLILLSIFTAPLVRAASPDREYIILSGGPSLMEWEKYKAAPHDQWWGNFIRSARIRIEDLRKEHGPSARITWLVYRPAYARRAARMNEPELISNITSVRDKYGVNLVWFSDGSEVIGYLNQGLPRKQIKIANLDFYGHSNSKAFLFDYSNQIDSASKAWLHEDELKSIHRGIFAKDAHIKSWGCHTAESFSKKWKKATGKKMIGAFGKTDYSHISTTRQISVDGRWGG